MSFAVKLKMGKMKGAFRQLRLYCIALCVTLQYHTELGRLGGCQRGEAQDRLIAAGRIPVLTAFSRNYRTGPRIFTSSPHFRELFIVLKFEYTLFLQEHAYKNIEAQICLKAKNILRTFQVHFCIQNGKICYCWYC